MGLAAGMVSPLHAAQVTLRNPPRPESPGREGAEDSRHPAAVLLEPFFTVRKPLCGPRYTPRIARAARTPSLYTSSTGRRTRASPAAQGPFQHRSASERSPASPQPAVISRGTGMIRPGSPCSGRKLSASMAAAVEGKVIIRAFLLRISGLTTRSAPVSFLRNGVQLVTSPTRSCPSGRRSPGRCRRS